MKAIAKAEIPLGREPVCCCSQDATAAEDAARPPTGPGRPLNDDRVDQPRNGKYPQKVKSTGCCCG